MVDLGQIAYKLHPKRVFNNLAISAISKFGPENDPAHNVDFRFKNSIFRRKNIKPQHYAAVYRTTQVICKHLEPKKDESMYLVASSTELIDTVLEKDKKAFKTLCDAMKKCARIGDPELWKEYEKELKGVLKGQAPFSDKITDLTERMIDTYITIGKYLPGQNVPPEMIGIGTVIFQYSKEPKHDIKTVGFMNRQEIRITKDLLRRYYASGRRFVFAASASDGNIPIDPFSENKGVYQHNQQEIGRYLNRMYYASPAQRRDAIIGLFSFSPSHPPLDRIEGIAKRLATLPAYYDPQMIKLRERLGKTPSSDILFSQLIDCITDEQLPEKHRVAITKLALLVKPEELSTGIGLISEVLDLDNQETQSALFQKIEDHVTTKDGNIKELFKEVFRASLGEFAIKYPEKPLEQVVDQFLSHPKLSERVTPEQMSRILEQYERYEAAKSGLVFDTIPELGEKLALLKQDPATEPAQYFAIFAEIFRKAYGLYPFNTQVLTCLMQLERAKDPKVHGVYSQVETGEGKSIDFAFMAAYYGVTGKKVDIVSFNEYLSMRDAERFGEFYAAVGLDSGAFSHNDIGSTDFDTTNIIYSTHVALVLHYLNQGLKGQYFLNNEPRIGLIDEADSLLLDNFESKARIASASREENQGNFSYAVYGEALKFVSAHREQMRDGGVDTVSLKDFRQKIQKHAKGRGIDWNDTDLLVLLHFAHEALYLVKGHDYIIRNIEGKDQIEILDSDNTGRRIEGSQWSYGLHECVAVKEGVSLPKSQDTIVEHSHHTFFNRYARIHCLSGTLGDKVDRRELQTLYGLNGFDVPPHRPSLRIDKGLSLFTSKEEQHAHLLKTVMEKVSAGRPLLVVASDINQAEVFHAILMKNGFPAQVLDDVNNRLEDGSPATEAEIIHRAGQKGQITIATNTSGRGTDVVIAPDTKEAGGLYVFIGFLPINTRVERQMKGRAGRQGNPGSCEIAALIDDGGFVERLTEREKALLESVVTNHGSQSDINLNVIQFLREIHGFGHSTVELFKTPFETTHDHVVEKFFNDMRETVDTIKIRADLPDDDANILRESILSEWAEVYRGYDRERALADIRLADFVKRAMKGEHEGVNTETLEQSRTAARNLANTYTAPLKELSEDERTLINDIVEEWSVTMTIGQDPELYRGCISYVERLGEVAEKSCKECILEWKDIIHQAHLDAREAAEAAKREAERRAQLDAMYGDVSN